MNELPRYPSYSTNPAFFPCFCVAGEVRIAFGIHHRLRSRKASPFAMMVLSVMHAQNFTFTWKPIVNGRLSEGIGGTRMKFAPTRLYSTITIGATTGPIV